AFSNAQPLFNEDAGVWTSIILIVAIAPWMYVGFDNIPQAAEEFKFSADKTFKLIVFGILASILTYVAMILVTSWIYPDQNTMDGAVWVTGSVISSSMGTIGMAFLAFAISFGVFTGLNGFFMSSSRLIFALGRARFVPEVFAKVHPKNKTPYVAVLFVLLVCLIAPWLGRTALNWIVDMSSVGVSIAFLATSAVSWKFFSRGESKNMLYVVFGILGTIISLIFLVLLLYPGSDRNVAVLFVLLVCLIAPWLGRTALNWIVDMSPVGVSIAFLATSAVSWKFFSRGESKNMLYVVFGILGTIISLIFLVLLLYPG